MNNIIDSITASFVGIALLLTPTVVFQGVMVALVAFFIWIEFFSKKFDKNGFMYAMFTFTGMSASILYYYAPSIQTDFGWTIALITFSLYTIYFLKYIWRMRKDNRTGD